MENPLNNLTERLVNTRAAVEKAGEQMADGYGYSVVRAAREREQAVIADITLVIYEAGFDQTPCTPAEAPMFNL